MNRLELKIWIIVSGIIMVLLVYGIIRAEENIVCDMCGSKNIEITTKQFKPTKNTESKKMSEWNGLVLCTTLEYRTTTYILRCKDCGFKVEVTQ